MTSHQGGKEYFGRKKIILPNDGHIIENTNPYFNQIIDTVFYLGRGQVRGVFLILFCKRLKIS